MLVKEEIVGKIKDYFELNIYETKVWLALLGKGSASAGEIATLSGVPRSRTYDVLESLEKKGFALVKLGKPVKYLGVKPKMIIEKLKNNVRSEAEEKVKILINLTDREEFKKLEELYNVGINPVKKENLSLSLKGRSLISNHVREVIESANKEVIICTNAEEMISKEKLFIETINELKRKKIKIKVALSGDENLLKRLEKSLETKIIKVNFDGKFFIVDRSGVLFYLSKESTKEDQAIWLNSEFFAKAFAELFDLSLKEK